MAILAEIQSRDEIGDHVVNGNRLRERVDPSRTNHDGEAFDERANHLERQTARADHNRCAELHDRDTCGAQGAAGLGATSQVSRQRRVVLTKATKVDDAADARARRRQSEVECSPMVQSFEARACRHGVDQVEGGVDAGERAIHGGLVQAVALHDRRRRACHGDLLRISRKAPHGAAACLERSKQAAADVAGGTGEKNDVFVHGQSASEPERDPTRIGKRPSPALVID